MRCVVVHPPARRLLVTGSRAWEDEATIRRELAARYRPGVVLVSGHCPAGADVTCERIWRELGGQVEAHPAEWRRYGRRAGGVRDREMVDAGAGECVAFIQDGSRGATLTAELAEAAGIPVARFQPSAADYDRRAGAAWQAGDLTAAARILERARQAHLGHAGLWDARCARVQTEMNHREGQAVLFGQGRAAR